MREKKISNMVSVAPIDTVCGNEGFRVSALPHDMREEDTRARMRGTSFHQDVPPGLHQDKIRHALD